MLEERRTKLATALTIWGKSDNSNGANFYHPLFFHMLDVATVTSKLWDTSTSPNAKSTITSQLGKNAYAKLLFLAGAHDIGKASPGFQKKLPTLSQYIPLEFLITDKPRSHGHLSAFILKQYVGPVLSKITGGHHGVFPRSSDVKAGRDSLGNQHWDETRFILLKRLLSSIDPNINLAELKGVDCSRPAIVPLLAGFITVSDWIASNQMFFPCQNKPGDFITNNGNDYAEEAQRRALKALSSLGWLPAAQFTREVSFEDMYSDFTPNNLQLAVSGIVKQQTTPYLMIIEAPTGCGKTEAAIFAADTALCKGFAKGFYIAMPTQATGNAMFRRVKDDYLSKRGHRGKLNLQLIHGDSSLVNTRFSGEETTESFKPTAINSYDNEKENDVEAQSWFTAKKRALLAPFGVGTVDQCMLSTLQTKHWFVRLFGLAGKVIIFDEIHAYDAYMNTIIERLLEWLAEMECTVIMLSATLPTDKRKALVKAYSGEDRISYKRYPRITIAKPKHDNYKTANKKITVKAFKEDGARNININLLENNLDTLAIDLLGKMQNGGCVAIICNTIGRAIEVFEYLKSKLPEAEFILFHARTLSSWRKEKEQEVLNKFGKGDKQANGYYRNENRPSRTVLIATQVIEQSLDVDFDLMYSEIAPIDLILQRTGRLHRHLRNRPKGLEEAEINILTAIAPDEMPPKSFGEDIEYVYERYILLRTYLELEKKSQISVPEDTEAMIDTVYSLQFSETTSEWQKELETAKQDMIKRQQKAQRAAEVLLISQPKHPDDLLNQFNIKLHDDDNPDIHKDLRAATREGDPYIKLILIRHDTVISSNPDSEEIQNLLDRSVKISHKGLYHLLKNTMQSPDKWKDNAHLRHARCLRLDHNNQALLGKYRITVDKTIGVLIEKEDIDNE